jgi:hypothetical protein
MSHDQQREQAAGSAADEQHSDASEHSSQEAEPSLRGLLRPAPDGSLPGASARGDERRLLLALQRSAGNAAVNRLLRQLAPPGQSAGPVPEASKRAGSLIVADSGPDPEPGQMRVGDFLDTLKQAICTTAEDTLTSPILRVTGCPWIEHWVEQYRGRDVSQIEAAVERYAPQASDATSASGLIGAVCARVREGIVLWQRTGELPAGVEEPGVSGAQAAPQQAVGFKLREGAPATDVDAADLRRRLGEGRQLEGGVAARMSRALGADVSGVRVHDDARSGRLATALGARAFAVGEHVAFGPNEYAPGTPLGDALIAHELAHVIQQHSSTGSPAPLSRSSALEEDADEAAVDAVMALHVPGARLAGLRRRVRPALRSGLQLQRCAGVQPAVRTPSTSGGIPEPVYTAGAPGANAIDAAAMAIRARAADTSRTWQERGVEAVRSIISTYYAPEADKVRDVIADPDLSSSLETEAATRPDARGTIKVSREFAENVGTTRNFSRYVLSVGHEILHINQQRAGMGGPGRQHEREFLAHSWTARAPEAAGTGRMSPQTRVGTIDNALGHYNQMTDEQKERHRAERERLLELRRTERARARDPGSMPENPP